MNGLINYVSGGMLWLGLLVRAPDLLRHRRDPYLRAICAVLGLAGLCFALGAPPTVGAVNRLSGVPNLAAPVTYAAITAYCAASQDRKSTRLNSSHVKSSYAVFCFKKKNGKPQVT